MPSSDHGTEVEPIPSVKDLASSDPSLRRATLTQLLSRLSSRPANHPPTPTQSLQLWRAFSVALYMHDSKSAVSVQNLIQTLASTIPTFYSKDIELHQQQPPAAAEKPWPWLSTWITAFYQTLSREWPAIDQWRINKYLLLIRFVLRETFSTLSSHASHTTGTPSTTELDTASLLTSHLHTLRSWPLSPRDRKVPDGLRLHVLDIWLDELAQIDNNDDNNNNNENTTTTAATTTTELKNQLIQPIRDLAKDAMTKSVRIKAKDVVKVFDEDGDGDGAGG